jgi:hypothetical protein
MKFIQARPLYIQRCRFVCQHPPELDKGKRLRHVRPPRRTRGMMTEFDQDLPPVLEPAPAPAVPPESSLLARLLNVFAIPGRVFEEVRGAARHRIGNWLVPALLSSVALALAGWVMLSMPTVWQQLAEQQAKFRAHQAAALAESVTAGKLTPSEVEQSLKVFDVVTRPAVMKSAAAAGGLAYGLGRVFWWAFVLWLLARTFLRRPVRYCKALEVAGLASMVALLSTVVMLALSVNVAQSFGPSGFALSVSDFAAPGRQTLTAVALNGTNLWLITVLGIGLARLTGVPWFRGTFLVLAYWLLTDSLLLLLGRGAIGA